jgi:molybdate transport system substrate-binding protein
MRAFALALVVIVGVIVGMSTARANELHASITTAMETAMAELVPTFEHESGNAVSINYGPSGRVARQFIDGKPADVIIIDSDAIDDLIKQGKVLPGRTDLARTGIGIAIRKGAPKPDVSTPEALMREIHHAL